MERERHLCSTSCRCWLRLDKGDSVRRFQNCQAWQTYSRMTKLRNSDLKSRWKSRAANLLNTRCGLRPQGISHVIREEILRQKRSPHPMPFLHISSHETDIKYYDPKKKLLSPTWEHNPLETSLGQVPKMFQEPEDFRRRLASSTFCHCS